MSTTDVGTGHGASISYEATPGSGTFGTEIALARVIPLPERTRAVHDKTHLKSPNNHREKFGGRFDTGPVPLTCIFTDASWSAAHAAMDVGTTGWKIKTAEGSEFTFPGFVSSIGQADRAGEGETTFTVTITPAGAGTWTEAPA
ncbi:phage tail tube protein [Nioella sp.]|uniref:phage tail tube protein n=1 Tax=Nioella sp. TaxID=1912091 RepID=UPI0035174C99